ncbi:hypothetical protein [Streptomyces sp. NL15-2K]|uniref:hypothetical protein n=1 Tax=Streptomyces sp. NL15-2K TaxID=376149 RepID=UPI000F588938|nr:MULTISPECIES: hypothetical protein [Actinomycetes]WKX10513.1 hypothetical protein Q4V64_24600 [Kutzneria buriramensis]GCB47953.1 gntR family transcriptional regulator [Streptomyces sp. NL15-2K]
MTDLTGTQPPWPDAALRLWQDSVRRASAEASVWRTPAPRGDEGLRAEIGSRFGQRPEQITITAGVRAAALTYARLFPVIHVERPTFPGVLHVLGRAGARVEERTWRELPAVPPAGAVWVTSPGRNPDGATLDAALREHLARRAAEGGRVVVNGAYLWFDPGFRKVPNADFLGSFHKIAGHGCRLGWVCGPSYFEEAVPELLGTTPSPVWQRAWALFAAEGGLDVLVAHTVDNARKAAEAFHAEAASRGAAGEPQAAPSAPHVLLRLAPGVSERRALSLLEARGFTLSPGESFRTGAPALRASFLGASCDEAVRLARLVTSTDIFDGRIE